MTELIIGLLLGFAIHYALYNYADLDECKSKWFKYKGK